VTITRNCAGTTSSRFDVSSPITCIGARQQRQLVSIRHDRYVDVRQMDRKRAAAWRGRQAFAVN
jgi:hypothetical protein